MKASDIPVLVTSVFLSFMLWTIVKTQERQAPSPSLFAVKVQSEGLDALKWAVTSIDETVMVRAEGLATKLEKMNPSDLIAVVDLRSVKIGKAKYPVIFTGPREFTELIINKTVMVSVEVDAVKRKRFQIEIEPRGEIRDQSLQYSGGRSDPVTVEVFGPAKQVDKVVKIRALLNLSDITVGNRGMPVSVALEALDTNEVPITKVQTEPLVASIVPAVIPAPQERVVLVSPEFVGSVASEFELEYTVQPNQVFLRGASQLLSKVSAIRTAPIALDQMTTSQEIIVDLIIPANLKLSKPGKVTVKITLKPRRGPQFDSPPTDNSTPPPDETQGGTGN